MFGEVMKKLEPNLSSIFSEIKSLDDSTELFYPIMEKLLETYSKDFLDIYRIEFDLSPLKEKKFREGWIKNWIRAYFNSS